MASGRHVLRVTDCGPDWAICKCSKSIDVGFEGLDFFCEAFIPLFKVDDIFDCFGENGCLRRAH